MTVKAPPASMNLAPFRTGPGTSESSGTRPVSRFSMPARAD